MKLKIKELRIKKNLTQDELCELSGVKKRSLLDYESGKTDVPFSKLHNIANALNVTVYDLIDDETFILKGPSEKYGHDPAVKVLEETIATLKDKDKMKDEIIEMLREKIGYTENKLHNCELQKKLLADIKKMD